MRMVDVGYRQLNEADDPTCSQLIAALLHCLDELAGVLEFAGDAKYVQHPVGVISGSLGVHVRHCLDHFETLLHLASNCEVNYDHRDRGTPIETDRCAALRRVAELKRELSRLAGLAPDQAVRFRGMITADGEAIEAASSVARELAFVLSHTIHHNAIIASICRKLNIPLPARFGYAPATSAHLAATGSSGHD